MILVYLFIIFLNINVNVNVNGESIFHYDLAELNNYKLFNGFDFDFVEIIYNKMQCNNWNDIIIYENITRFIPEEKRIFSAYLMIHDGNKQIILYVNNEFININDRSIYTNRKRYECNTTLIDKDDCFYYDYVEEFNILKYTISEHINKLYYKYLKYDLILISNEYESNILQLYSVYLRYKYNIYTNTLYSYYSNVFSDNLMKVGNEKVEEKIKDSIVYRYRVVNEYQDEYQTKIGLNTLYNVNLVNHDYKLCDIQNFYCFNSTDKITPLKVNCKLIKLK